MQCLLHDGRGEWVSMHTEECELKAVVQGMQDGLKVGVPDSALF